MQVCFANISATKPRIFTKFNMVVNYYLVNLRFKLYEDLCINARARVINVRTLDKTCARVFRIRAIGPSLQGWSVGQQ